MSIETQITRLKNAKTALASALAGKGITVPGSTKLDGYAALLSGAASVVNVSGDTVTADKLTKGYTAHNAAGAKITGTMEAVGGETATLTANALEAVTATVYNADGTTTALSIPAGTSTHTVPKYAFIEMGIECSGSFEWGGSSTGSSGQVVSDCSGCQAFNAVAQVSDDSGMYIEASETTAGIIVTSNQASITINREMDVMLA